MEDGRRIPVVELFGPTIQGEGALAGRVSYFIRTGGCEYRCSWCDSMHAVDPERIKTSARYMTEPDILLELQLLDDPYRMSARRNHIRPWVTLTGGDPVMWDMYNLVSDITLRVAVETQGAMWRDWLEQCDLVTCSPKPPSSGMADRLNPAILGKYSVRLGSKLVFKIVVFNDEDLAWAVKLHQRFPHVPMYLTSGTPQPASSQERFAYADLILKVCAGYRWLAERVTQIPELHDVTVSPQMHTLAWGMDLGR